MSRQLSEAESDANFLHALTAFVNRKASDSSDTSELVHVTRALDGSIINVEGVDQVIEELRDDIRALRDAFEEYRKEQRELRTESTNTKGHLSR
jgi:chromosome segregation ATPase